MIYQDTKQTYFLYLKCQWLDATQCRPDLYHPSVAINDRVVRIAQLFIATVSSRLLLRKTTWAHWRKWVQRRTLREHFLHWRDCCTANRLAAKFKALRRSFYTWLNTVWARRSARHVLRRSMTMWRQHTLESRATKFHQQQLLRASFYRLQDMAQHRQNLFFYTTLQIQTVFLGVYLNQEPYQQLKIASVLTTLVNNVNQNPFFYILKPNWKYQSLWTRFDIASSALHDNVLKWLTVETQKDSRPAFNFQYMLKKNQYQKNCYLLLQNRFRQEWKILTPEISVYLVFVHLHACVQKMKVLLRLYQPSVLDERYRDTTFLRELQQEQVRLLQNPVELELYMYQWQQQHPFYRHLSAPQLVQPILGSLLVTKFVG